VLDPAKKIQNGIDDCWRGFAEEVKLVEENDDILSAKQVRI